ncbi:class I SAM-dependent methyltransferase [Dactylosporangium sp. NPDC050688]|uniref:class I SAM-dependent methyltransferase n=1 Tax=Dactylosporangium sp. NPDC050688 TaxID=3157217 RepID=UPI0034104C87
MYPYRDGLTALSGSPVKAAVAGLSETDRALLDTVDHVVDLGCGNGAPAAALVPVLPTTCRWLLVEKDEGQLVAARSRLRSMTSQRVDGVCADLTRLPFERLPSGPGLILISHVLYYLPGWQDVLSWLVQKARSSGSALVVVMRSRQSASYQLRACIRTAQGGSEDGMLTAESVQSWLKSHDVPYSAVASAAAVSYDLTGIRMDDPDMVPRACDRHASLYSMLSLLCHTDPAGLDPGPAAALTNVIRRMVHRNRLDLLLDDLILVVSPSSREVPCRTLT